MRFYLRLYVCVPEFSTICYSHTAREAFCGRTAGAGAESRERTPRGEPRAESRELAATMLRAADTSTDR